MAGSWATRYEWVLPLGLGLADGYLECYGAGLALATAGLVQVGGELSRRRRRRKEEAEVLEESWGWGNRMGRIVVTEGGPVGRTPPRAVR
jgi:hypothetical protein